MSASGLCGSVIVDHRGIIGMHSAGITEGEAKIGLGLAMIWPKEVISDVNNILVKTKNMYFNLELHPDTPGKVDCSVVKMHNVDGIGSSVPTKTSYVLSNVAGIFPLDKVPANLKQKNIIKDMAKKSYTPVKDVNPAALDYSTSYLKAIIPRFSKVSEHDVIKGFDLTNRINKKTGCGFSFPAGKEEYIDYEKGEYKPHFRERINNFKNSIIKGEIDYRDCIFEETLKDELRLVHKKDSPRCFKMCPLTLTCLGREYFLDLINKLGQEKFNNGIMVGINPFSDFKKLVSVAIKFDGNVNDGDYGKWDGSMLPQFQQSTAVLLSEKFESDDVNDFIILNFLLMILNYTPTLNMNEILITTHSIPSGNWMTAVYNCLINKKYGAYIFYLCYLKHYSKSPTVQDYIKNVFDAVYGDDKWMVVSNQVKDFFNGQTFRDECHLLGLEYTAADKGADIEPYHSVYETTFLKRGFRYSDVIQDIVCPLDATSMKATLNFVSDINRRNELTVVKLLNFQREAFLHENYHELIDYVKHYCETNGIEVFFLSEDYLKELYSKDPMEYSKGLIDYDNIM
jgi:hypothetical protein